MSRSYRWKLATMAAAAMLLGPPAAAFEAQINAKFSNNLMFAALVRPPQAFAGSQPSSAHVAISLGDGRLLTGVLGCGADHESSAISSLRTLVTVQAAPQVVQTLSNIAKTDSEAKLTASSCPSASIAASARGQDQAQRHTQSVQLSTQLISELQTTERELVASATTRASAGPVAPGVGIIEFSTQNIAALAGLALQF